MPSLLVGCDTTHRPHEAQEEGRLKCGYFDSSGKVDQNAHGSGQPLALGFFPEHRAEEMLMERLAPSLALLIPFGFVFLISLIERCDQLWILNASVTAIAVTAL